MKDENIRTDVEKPKRDLDTTAMSMVFTVMLMIPEYYYYFHGEVVATYLMMSLAIMFWSVGAVNHLNYMIKYRKWKHAKK